MAARKRKSESDVDRRMDSIDRTVGCLEGLCLKLSQQASRFSKFDEVVGRYLDEICTLEARNEMLKEVCYCLMAHWDLFDCVSQELSAKAHVCIQADERLRGLEDFYKRFHDTWGAFTPEELGRAMKAQSDLLEKSPVQFVEENNRAHVARQKNEALIAKHRADMMEMEAKIVSAEKKAADIREVCSDRGVEEGCL